MVVALAIGASAAVSTFALVRALRAEYRRAVS